MNITIRFYSILRHRDGKFVDRIEIESKMGSNVQDVLDELEIKNAGEILILINDVKALVTDKLENGDTLILIPLISGG